MTKVEQFNEIRNRWHNNDWKAEDGHQRAEKIHNELTKFVTENLPAKEIQRGELETERTNPSTIKLGDLVADYGYIGRVVEIKEFPNSAPEGHTCYQLLCEYVSGDLKMFNYFRGQTLNGTGPRDYRAMIQGNKLRSLYKLK